MNACPKSVFLQQRVVASAAHNFRGQGFFNRRWYCRDMLLFNCSSDCPMLTIHDVNYTTRQSSSTAAVQRVVVNFSLTTCSRYSAFLIEIFVFSRHLTSGMNGPVRKRQLFIQLSRLSGVCFHTAVFGGFQVSRLMMHEVRPAELLTSACWVVSMLPLTAYTSKTRLTSGR